MMAAELKRWYDEYPYFQKRDLRRRAQKDNRFLGGSQIAYLIYEITERGAVTKQKRAKNFYTERKSEECFQWKTNGSPSRRDA